MREPFRVSQAFDADTRFSCRPSPEPTLVVHADPLAVGRCRAVLLRDAEDPVVYVYMFIVFNR